MTATDKTDRLLGMTPDRGLDDSSAPAAPRPFEEAPIASEERYRALFEHSPEPVLLVSATGEVFGVNPAGCRLLQRSEEELCAGGAALCTLPGDPQFAALAEELGRTGTVRGPLTLVRKDGTHVPVEVSASAFVDRAGRERVSLIVKDLSDRQRADEALRLLTAACQLLPSSLDVDTVLTSLARLAGGGFCDIVVIDVLEGDTLRRRIDFGGGVVPEARRCYSLPRSAPPRPRGATRALATGEAEFVPVVTEAWLVDACESDALLAEARASAPSSVIVVALKARDAIVGTVCFLRRDGRRPFEATDVQLAQGLADRTALALDNAHLYAAAVHARQVRDEMLGVVSHDLRSPLNAIRLSARVLRRLGPNEHVDAIGHAVDRADRLVQDLLAITALEAGALPLDRARCPASAIVAEVALLHRPLAAERGIALDEQPGAGVPPVDVDFHRMVQALSNVVVNALRFAPAGGVVELRSSHCADGVALEVHLGGTGIPPADQPHLFDRFWRVRDMHGGLGLGLAIARGIAEAHGGALAVRSEPGEGATFTLTLPAA